MVGSEAVPFSLDRVGPTPIYQQIREWMDQQILSGVWPEHYKLSAETELAASLNVSRGTIRHAIASLIDEGKLVQIHGRGTFVSSSFVEQPLAERLITVAEDLIDKQIPYQTEVLEQAVIRPSQQVASLLALPAKAEVFYLKRRRIVGGTPLILLNNYVSIAYCPGIETIDFTRYSLFEALEAIFGLPLDWAQRSFEAQVADASQAALLNIAEAAPVLFMEQVLYLESGVPVELSNNWIRGDRFRLSATLNRKNALGPLRGSHDYNFE